MQRQIENRYSWFDQISKVKMISKLARVVIFALVLVTIFSDGAKCRDLETSPQIMTEAYKFCKSTLKHLKSDPRYIEVNDVIISRCGAIIEAYKRSEGGKFTEKILSSIYPLVGQTTEAQRRVMESLGSIQFRETMREVNRHIYALVAL